MNIIFILIGVSLAVAILFLSAFLWSVKSGQYDDNYTPSVRMLFEDGKSNTQAPIRKDELKKQDLKDDK